MRRDIQKVNSRYTEESSVYQLVLSEGSDIQLVLEHDTLSLLEKSGRGIIHRLGCDCFVT